jgi:prefoldin subunit 5
VASQKVQQITILEEKIEILSRELNSCHDTNKELEKWKAKLEKESKLCHQHNYVLKNSEYDCL